ANGQPIVKYTGENGQGGFVTKTAFVKKDGQTQQLTYNDQNRDGEFSDEEIVTTQEVSSEQYTNFFQLKQKQEEQPLQKQTPLLANNTVTP
ncbi:MAG: hypothetical protein WCF95_05765, partial [bacterium]